MYYMLSHIHMGNYFKPTLIPIFLRSIAFSILVRCGFSYEKQLENFIFRISGYNIYLYIVLNFCICIYWSFYITKNNWTEKKGKIHFFLNNFLFGYFFEKKIVFISSYWLFPVYIASLTEKENRVETIGLQLYRAKLKKFRYWLPFDQLQFGYYSAEHFQLIFQIKKGKTNRKK